ncbi:RNP-1 like RNA-binding protein [Powellomyces hirtus]|nr:RNP-1 like RNA-binding protein [Powellomyces hirtus]
MLPLFRPVSLLAPRALGISALQFSTKRIFVGNLPWAAQNEDLTTLFAKYGEVKGTRIMIDRNTGRSRGFAFVEIDEEAAEKAIEGLNGYDLKGRELRVNEATPMEDRGTGGSGGYGGNRDGGYRSGNRDGGYGGNRDGGYGGDRRGDRGGRDF